MFVCADVRGCPRRTGNARQVCGRCRAALGGQFGQRTARIDEHRPVAYGVVALRIAFVQPVEVLVEAHLGRGVVEERRSVTKVEVAGSGVDVAVIVRPGGVGFGIGAVPHARRTVGVLVQRRVTPDDGVEDVYVALRMVLVQLHCGGGVAHHGALHHAGLRRHQYAAVLVVGHYGVHHRAAPGQIDAAAVVLLRRACACGVVHDVAAVDGGGVGACTVGHVDGSALSGVVIEEETVADMVGAAAADGDAAAVAPRVVGRRDGHAVYLGGLCGVAACRQADDVAGVVRPLVLFIVRIREDERRPRRVILVVQVAVGHDDGAVAELECPSAAGTLALVRAAFRSGETAVEPHAGLQLEAVKVCRDGIDLVRVVHLIVAQQVNGVARRGPEQGVGQRNGVGPAAAILLAVALR